MGMRKNNHSKYQELNEYGEISISSQKPEFRKQPWEAKFLKIMVVLFLVISFLMVVFNQ